MRARQFDEITLRELSSRSIVVFEVVGCSGMVVCRGR